MSDTQLNREFEKKDVQRMRNLIAGKYGEKSTQGVGYSKKEEEYKEGDIWVEDERQWTIKNGIKQNITKLDKAKDTNAFPLFCPCCNKLMKNQNDPKFYNIHKKCMNCVIDFETKLKFEGKWEEYEKQVHNDHIDNMIKEFREWVVDETKELNQSFITEDGIREHWVGNNHENIKKNIEESIKYLENLKK
jgi:hypothetical protein